MLRYAKQFHNDDFKDEDMFEKISKTQIEEFDLLINALQVDVCISMIRNELKDGVQRDRKKQQKTEDMRASSDNEIQLIKEQQGLQGIADYYIKKTNLMNEPHSRKIKSDAFGLQMNLQKSGNRAISYPVLTDYEKKLVKETHENTYVGALLYMMLALNKTLETEQRQLLTESLGTLG